MSPLKSSVGRTLGKLVKTFATNNIGTGIARASTQKATGGTTFTQGKYTLHVFTSPGTFTVNNRDLVASNVLVVGGGGAGARTNGTTLSMGGGGAGGMLEKSNFTFAAGSYPVTIGDGGTAQPHPSPADANGGNSVLSTLIAYGGGGGATTYRTGGSGAGGGPGPIAIGGSGNIVTGTENTAITPEPLLTPQGNPGGNLSPSNGRAGGGGGAGAAGEPGAIPTPGGARGGNGLPITWVPGDYGTPGTNPGRYFAGGGGGSGQQPGRPGGIGGEGGGGTGGNTPADLGGPGPTAGQANTGGGGGGGTYPTGDASPGGSGIIIVRYSTQ